MSFYRQSPSRSEYRSPLRAIETERDLIRQEMSLRRSIQTEVESRHMLDQISLLKIRLRKMEEVQDRCDALIKQNAMLKQENDVLGRELNQIRYETDKYRLASAEIQQRESFKATQLIDLNHHLEFELGSLRREREQNNKIFESNVLKLEMMLSEKISELESLSIRYASLANEKEVSDIRAQQEISKLRTIMSRNVHDLQREYEYNREKQINENALETDTMKKNYSSQIMLLEDENKKLEVANRARTLQFQSQIAENRALKVRHQEEVRALVLENDRLRERMLKLEDLNRSEVEKIQQKYSDHHTQDTTSLKEQFRREMRVLLEETNNQKWLINEKNSEIQNLVRQKKEQRQNFIDRELEFTSVIGTLKNKLIAHEEKSGKDNHALMERINSLSDKLVRESDNYHLRAKNFNKKTNDLESEIKYKQNLIEKLKSQAEIKNQQGIRNREQLEKNLERKTRELKQSEQERKRENLKAKQDKQSAERELERLGSEINDLEVQRDSLKEKSKSSHEGFGHSSGEFKRQIESLKKKIAILDESLSQEQSKHANQLSQLADKMSNRVQQLQKTQRQTIDQITSSKTQQLENLNQRVQKTNREKQQMESDLKKYIKMYEQMEKYFPNPHQGALSEIKGDSNVYEVLSKVTKSSVHIF